MDKRTNKSISDFVSKVAEHFNMFDKAYLFGSFAKQNNKSDSDIDIALIITNLEDDNKFDVQVQLMMLAAEFDLRIEPHPISTNDFDSGNPFAMEIKKTGIRIEEGALNSLVE